MGKGNPTDTLPYWGEGCIQKQPTNDKVEVAIPSKY